MVGQNIGAKKYHRIPKIMKTAFVLVFAIDFVLSLLLIFFPDFVFGIFTSDKEVIEASMAMIPVLVIIFISSSCRAPFNGLVGIFVWRRHCRLYSSSHWLHLLYERSVEKAEDLTRTIFLYNSFKK